jgi:hypothetical protein
MWHQYGTKGLKTARFSAPGVFEGIVSPAKQGEMNA